MSLTEISIPRVIHTSKFTFSTDFIIPALKNSIRYDRGVGYFTSGWIKNNIKGIIPFIENGGIARWITSPILTQTDTEALKKGTEAQINKGLYDLLYAQTENLLEAIEKDVLLALAWLVADRRLIFRIAIPTEKLEGGDFHDKFGIFTDQEGNQISFSGSYNETAKGEINYESLKIFHSWEPVLNEFVDSDVIRFEDIWNSKDPNLRIYSLPTAIRNKIVEYAKHGDRPYKLVPVVYVHTTGDKRSIKLRPYQEAALEEWLSHDFKGTFRMATGTGKTFTAIFCIREFYNREKYGIPIIICPYLHLIRQWQSSLEKLDYECLLCQDDSKKWSKALNTKLQESNINKKLGIEQKRFAVICTYDAFFSPLFQEILSSVNFPTMIIADEVHNLGTRKRLRTLPQSTYYRLGLSATPERFMDEDGTKGIFDYFGGVIYSLDLFEAIFKLKVLSHYEYVIKTVQLNDAEFEEYKAVNREIAKLLSEDEEAIFSNELDRLFLKRANILNNCAAKLNVLRGLLKSIKQIDKTLIYCSPNQLSDVNHILLDEFSIVVHQVTYREKGDERTGILRKFENGIYQVITAIRCLDEGLDVPSISRAIILASSSNPKEFIQRRGRVLRISENKGKPTIIDLMALPPAFSSSVYENKSEYNVERGIIAKELKRIHHFASCADNKNEVLLSVYDLASKYNLQAELLGE